jgi:protoheme IX farnesyltransferase
VRAAALLLVLLAAQVILGGVTVKTETAASIVALHLSIALTLFSVLILIASGVVLAGRPQGTGVASRDGLASHPGLAAATIAATLALIVLGAYVSQTGAGLAYPDWPLFDGKLVSAGGRLADLHYAHRLVAAVAGVLLGALAWQTFREERAGPVRLAVPVACALYVAQVFVGAGNIWLDLATSVRIVHLALASALWGVIVFAVIWSFLAPRAGGARR